MIRKLPALRFAAWTVEGTGVFVFWGICWCLGPRHAANLGARLFAWIGPRTQKERHLQRNLAMLARGNGGNEGSATAEVSLESGAACTDSAASWRNIGRVLAEYPHLRKLAEALPVVVAPDSEALLVPHAQAVFVTAHLANWELGAAALSASGVQLTAIYAPQDNPLLDRFIQKRREALGCKFIDKATAVRGMLRALQGGRSPGLLPDQRVDPGRLPSFFGQPAPTTIAAARIALRHDLAYVPFRTVRGSDGSYEVRIEAPIQLARAQELRDFDATAQHSATSTTAEEDAAAALTQAYLKRVEAWIAEYPDQWLCVKRRWPKEATLLPGAGAGQRDAPGRVAE